MTEPVGPQSDETPARNPPRRPDLLPLGRHYQTALGCSVLVALSLAAFYLWRC